MIDFTVIGNRIQRARKKKKYTQQDMADFLGVSVPYISKIETGKAVINLTRLSEISTFLDVDIGVLVSGSNKNSQNYLIPELSDIFSSCSSEEMDLAIRILREVFREKF